MNHERVASNFPYQSKFIDLNDTKMHYIEEGEGDPILFLHGIPTSCYIWRNIIPHLTALGRCIAPDLIGFGKSGKPNIDYHLSDHCRFIESFIEKLNLKNIILVVHGFGSIIGLDYAMRNPERFKGIVFYESYLRPVNTEDFSLPYAEQNYQIQNEDVYQTFMNGATFIDRILPLGMIRPLSDEELKYYREPFLEENTQKPLLQYLQELPRDNNETNQMIANYSEKLVKSSIPKLMLYSVPGFITTIATVMWAKENLQNLQINEVGEALHYGQESNPVLIGESISVWLQGLPEST
jgi:haloalkane dehalogenase